MISYPSIGIGAAAAIGIMMLHNTFFAYPAIREETRAQVAAEARERAMALIEQRNKDNAEISNFDVRDLCRELGGRWVPEQNTCD